MSERSWKAGRGGGAGGLLLAESQMADSMLGRLGQLRQTRPQSRSGWRLEDAGVWSKDPG